MRENLAPGLVREDDNVITSSLVLLFLITTKYPAPDPGSSYDPIVTAVVVAVMVIITMIIVITLVVVLLMTYRHKHNGKH